MTNRTLTALAIRFAALLLFMKIFEFFGAYAISVFYTAAFTFAEQKMNTSFDKFYFHGTFLLVSNAIISLFLFFKADWISARIIKEDKTITIQLTPEKIIMSILLTTGIIWLASSIYLLPDAYDYTRMMLARFNHQEFGKNVDFSPVYFIMKTTLAIIFVFRVDKVTRFLSKKMAQRELQEDIVKHDVDGGTTA